MTESVGLEPPILTTTQSGVLRIQFNRPRARTAINWALRRQLRTVLDVAAQDDDVRSSDLGANGKKFLKS